MPGLPRHVALASWYRCTSSRVHIRKSSVFCQNHRSRSAVKTSMAEPPPPTSVPHDRDLTSMAEARTLARRAKQAWLELAEVSQEKVDAIVKAMAEAATSQAESFARLAVEETGYGVVAD